MAPKEDLVAVPPSIQVAAASALLKKAYQPYHLPEPSSGQQTMFDLYNQDVAKAFDPASAPTLKLGAKVCLTYDRLPEVYVVVGAAYGPDHPVLDAKEAEPIADALGDLAMADFNETANAPTDTTEQLAEVACPPDRSRNFICLVVPVAGSGVKALKPTVDLTTAKTVLEKNLSVPPRFVVGHILTINVPIDRHDNKVALPVEISSVQRGRGFDAGSAARGAGLSVAKCTAEFNAPWEDLWKYKLVHSGAWVSEQALAAMVDATVESLVGGQINWL